MEEDKEALAEESMELLEDLRESIEEAVCVARCVRVSAETTCEDISLIRGVGAVEKLLKHASGHELAQLEARLRGMCR